MHAVIQSAAFLLLMTALGCQVRAHGPLVDNAFVIEYDDTAKTDAVNHRMEIYNQLNANNISHSVRHEYDFLNAISVSFDSVQDAQNFFNSAKGIKRVWPVSAVTKPKVETSSVSNEAIPSLFNFYQDTGINRVRNELGITGKGIKVGIIDTGVDYAHPALGGCFGPNCRVAYGYDFVGDKYDGTNMPVPDNDPRDICNGHGTHVTGIIGADDKEENFTGIAPEVTFGAYRIFGCSGSSSDDVIMKAMERAYQDGMDVINLSLGDVGWPESPASLLADKLATMGMIVCAAAGNEGAKGAFEVGAPSLGRHAISIASVDNSRMLAHAFKAGDLNIGYTTSSNKPFNITSGNVVMVSDLFSPPKDACEQPQDSLKGKLALISRGGCLFEQKIINAQKAGAIGALVYNNVPGMITPSVGHPNITIFYGGISQEDGKKLFDYLKTDDRGKVEFLANDQSFPVVTAGSVSSFSSWGLGPDLSLKPDISAPGGFIFSTFPTTMGKYATLSGTSMASPHVAGIVALLQQTRGGGRSIPVDDLRALLINNGHPIKIANSENIESVARQGSGLVDVYRAIISSTAVSPEQLRLSNHISPDEKYEYQVTIKNNDRMRAEYQVSHVSAVTAQAYEQDKAAFIPLAKPVVLANHEVEAVVEIPEPVIVVEANEEANVTVRIRPPSNADSFHPSIYSGYLVIKKNNDDQNLLHVPYAGLTSDLDTLPVLHVNETMPRIIQRNNNKRFSLLMMQLTVASPMVVVKVVNATDPTKDLGFVPGGIVTFVGRNDVRDPHDVFVLPWYGSVVQNEFSTSKLSVVQPSFAGHRPQSLMHPDITTSQFAHLGTPLPPGKYQLKIQALRPFGDAKNEADFHSWLSPEINN